MSHALTPNVRVPAVAPELAVAAGSLYPDFAVPGGSGGTTSAAVIGTPAATFSGRPLVISPTVPLPAGGFLLGPIPQFPTFPVAEFFKDPTGRIVPTNSSITPLGSPYEFRFQMNYPSLLHDAIVKRYYELTVHARMFTTTSEVGSKNGFQLIVFEGSLPQIQQAYQALHKILILA